MLIEDDQAIGAALQRGIERAGMQACWAKTGGDAVALKASFLPDVALVDLELPDTNGLVLIKWLVDQGNCGVIVVSGAADMADRVIGLELGADDYVAKPPTMRELVARIRAVHRRVSQRILSEPHHAALSAGGIRIDPNRRTVHGPTGERIVLTAAEYTVLEALSLAQGQVVSRDRLSETALHRRWRPEDRSIDQLVLNLRQKLPSDADGKSLIESIRGSGYLLRPTATKSLGQNSQQQ
jgi:DNA-binding response OmpR family regulator